MGDNNFVSSHASFQRREFPFAAGDELKILLGERFTQGRSIIEAHGRDESGHAPACPDAVVFPKSTEEVSQIVKICGRHAVPIIPYGAGTSVEGHVLAVEGGVTIDFSNMNRIVEIRERDLDATVQAGVTRLQFDAALRSCGLFFPVDPGADATFGGMAATGASGTTSVRYGTIRDNIVCMTFVDAHGRILKAGSRVRKSSSGYDLRHVLIGSEGTLGIITELTVRLHPLPEAISAAVASFPTVTSAIDTVIQSVQLGIPIARAEYVDGQTIAAVNCAGGLQLSEQPTLFIEFHGSPMAVAEQIGVFKEIADEHGVSGFEWSAQPEDRTRLWKARHNAFPAFVQTRPGTRHMTTDVCVPISRLAECIEETYREIERARLPVALFGHIGDGNFHLVILIDPEEPDDLRRADRLNSSVVHRALSMEGTCTGEHGIGLGKKRYLEIEHSPDSVDVMRSIKNAFDPARILNPGKVIP